jgi:hypothetical protein
MPSHNDNELPSHDHEEIDASHGYERSDVRISGIVVFLTALGIFVVVTAVLCYGIGKVFNAYLKHEDGPNTKWTKDVDKDIRQLGDFPNSPDLQNKVATLTEQFPTPRLQWDDGNQDVADLHAREDLLLDNYTRIDGQPGKVRIPIDRAMELIAERGLPIAPASEISAHMTGDREPQVQAPLTTGFARTAYEQEQAKSEGRRTEAAPGQQ